MSAQSTPPPLTTAYHQVCSITARCLHSEPRHHLPQPIIKWAPSRHDVCTVNPATTYHSLSSSVLHHGTMSAQSTPPPLTTAYPQVCSITARCLHSQPRHHLPQPILKCAPSRHDVCTVNPATTYHSLSSSVLHHGTMSAQSTPPPLTTAYPQVCSITARCLHSQPRHHLPQPIIKCAPSRHDVCTVNPATTYHSLSSSVLHHGTMSAQSTPPPHPLVQCRRHTC